MLTIDFRSLIGKTRLYVNDFFSAISYSPCYAFKWLSSGSGETHDRFIRFPYGVSVVVKYNNVGVAESVYVNGGKL